MYVKKMKLNNVCQQCTSVDNALDTTESPAVYTCTSAGDTQLVGNCAENHWKNSEGDADTMYNMIQQHMLMEVIVHLVLQ